MILASSPYRKTGALFNRWRDYFGRDDAEVMVWQAPSRVMNETIPQKIIDNAMRDDPARASRNISPSGAKICPTLCRAT